MGFLAKRFKTGELKSPIYIYIYIYIYIVSILFFYELHSLSCPEYGNYGK